MTAETLPYIALSFAWRFVVALWLHDSIKGLVHRMVDMAMRRRDDET